MVAKREFYKSRIAQVLIGSNYFQFPTMKAATDKNR